MDNQEKDVVYRRRPTASERKRRMEDEPEQNEPRQLDDPPTQPQLEDPPTQPQIQDVQSVQPQLEDPPTQPQIQDVQPVEQINEEENDTICPTLLTNFKDHVAADILRGVERGVLKCHNHVNKLTEWSFQEIDSTLHFRNHFRDSGLLRVKDVSYKHVNKSLITAFVERWHSETNSFHMPFGEMTITLDDVYCLTGLPVHCHPVLSTHSDRAPGKAELEKLLGLTPAEVKEAMEGAKGSSVKVEWLKKKFSSYVESQDDDRVLYAARAYALYVFGCSLFSDKSGTRVSLGWLAYVENMERLSGYAWGAATLAHLYKQLGEASKQKCRQISGYLTLLEAWIYERFPSLLRPPLNLEFTNEYPLAMRWSTTVVAPTQMRLISLREALDDMTETEVNWDPYASVRDRFPLLLVTFYDGCISVNAVVEPYMQDRVLRQYGYIQKVPETPYVHKLQRSSQSGADIKRAWNALTNQFKRVDSHSLSTDRLGLRAFPAWQCSDDYMQWFTTNSHVRVQPQQQRQTQVQPQMISIHPQDRIARALMLMDPILYRWKSGDNPGTWDEACTVMDAVRVALRMVDDDEPEPSSGPRVRRRTGR